MDRALAGRGAGASRAATRRCPLPGLETPQRPPSSRLPGTHGHMKCQFDGQLKSQDTVLMTLYKRLFPKWTYDPHVPEPCGRGESPLPCPEEQVMD